MSVFPNNTFLGVAVGERTLKLAELAATSGASASASSSARGRWEVRRSAEFEIPPDADDAAVGAALSRFLRDNRFSAGRAVLGVPARWLVSRDRDLPPSTPEQAAGALRLQAERLFSSEPRDLVFDYAGAPSPAGPSTALLVGMPRRQLDRAAGWAKAAGLRVLGVTPTTLALAAASSSETSGGGGDGLLLNLSPGEVELSAGTARAPRLLRHLPVRGADLSSLNGTSASAVAALAGEVRRVVALAPPSGGASGRPPPSVLLWDGVGLNPQQASELARHAGVEIKPRADLSLMGVTAPASGPASGPGESSATSSLAPAVALALAAAGQSPLAVDFLHSKLIPPKPRRVGRVGVWAAAVGAALALALAVLLWDLYSRGAELAELKARSAKIAPDVRAAETTARRVATARGWFESRPEVLECLREITLAFPDGEPVYVTSLTLRDGGKGQLLGRGVDQEQVLTMSDRLKNNRKFTDVTVSDMHEADGGSREVAFSVSFTFNDAAARDAAALTETAPAEPPAPRPDEEPRGSRRRRGSRGDGR